LEFLTGLFRHETGVSSGDVFVSFKAIFQDVREAMEHIHNRGDLKRLTVADMDKYVVSDERLALLFDRMRENGRKVFLMTNSGFEYTHVRRTGRNCQKALT